MKQLCTIIILFSLIILGGCAGITKNPDLSEQRQSIIKPKLPGSATVMRQLMTGKWYGEMRNETGELQAWLDERYNDGTFKITFRLYKEDNTYDEQIEVGLWGVSGDIYFSITKGWVKEDEFLPSDPENPYFYDAYKIISLTLKSMVYEGFERRVRYDARKVGDDFEWP